MLLNEGVEYVAVQIRMDGFSSDEVIVNDKYNIYSKLAYYKETYNEDLEHRWNPGVRILGFAYGYSFSGIIHELGLLI
ncbi:hypothetical protein WR52_11405 [Bacillus cereus]|uniref:Uncharacterized protein n=3 Tax=Bacillus cereus group TaxID=86661 RepID=A0A9W5L5S3_BACCE|nr:hypothetical protein WR52_11405 [Bacillus cereus]EEM47989.1 hypothetical protein bthur0005_20850 [Bacillus thuringiensis serovar pakistani str. T13001]EEM83879.1 hypothetical protein bthur0011_20370 [Bacillus thuringiensis serovar huazhongensis BGSC 4BD1]EJR23577.1 hypothetical protein IIA_02075 [Bacillus cereus VD014]EJR77910.1 hypothetical protein IK5_00211 [Bacillus cereus VD154]EJR99774.1 hypothetical protein IKG_02086 [Bacillus cereus VD200]KIU76066.1 hypothetical protein C797_04976 [